MILTELYENLLQAQNINGTLLAGGKVYVYYLGRSDLADTWTDIDGEGLNTNPIILDAQGMCKCYVDTSYDYTVVVKDRFDQLIFTRDKYIVSDGKTQGGGAGVVVQGSNNIDVDHTVINDKDVYTISGKDYEGVEPIVVNNDLRRISANTVAFGVREPLYFVQDDDQATIIGMSGDPANTAWVAENFYSASNPSAFVTSGELTSVSAEITAMIPTALTGDYLTKDSADTLYYGIDNPSSFVTSGELTAVSADITAMIPTALTGDYLTKDSADTLYQPIGAYLTTADSAMFQPYGSYLSSTDSAKFYPTGNPSGFATVSEVSSYSGQINSITAQLDSAYSFVAGSGISLTDDTANKTTTIAVTAHGGNTAVEQLVINSSGTWDTVSSKLDKVSADTLYQPIGSYLTTSDSANFYTTANDSGFITSAGQTVTSTAGDGTYITAINGMGISGQGGGGLTGLFQAQYGTTTYSDIKNAVDNHKIVYCQSGGRLAFLAYSGNNNYEFQYYRSITGHTTANQGDQVFVYTISSNNNWSVTTRNTYTEIKPSAGLASAFTNGTAAKLAFSVSDDILNATATLAAASAGWNDKVDSSALSDYATTALVSSVSAEVISSLTSADYELVAGSGISIVDDSTAKTTTISVTGASVPEGVLVESGLEYNAVNEISGYNGSAIAQYGAEKQWLQHDDTIVHVSNSAQYAFGVNLSAVAQLLGVDETVLWETNEVLYQENSAVTLSENFKNFKELDVYYQSPPDDNYTANKSLNIFRIDPTRVGTAFSIGGNYILSNDWWVTWCLRIGTSADGTSMYITNAHHTWGQSAYSNGFGDFNNNGQKACGGIYKVVGIGRKEV